MFDRALNTILRNVLSFRYFILFSWARARACVFILFHRKGFFHLQRCLWHTWGVRINDLVLWVLFWVLLPSSFISASKNVVFHLQRRNSSTLTNWRENDICCQPAKRWYILIQEISLLLKVTKDKEGYSNLNSSTLNQAFGIGIEICLF